MTPRVTVPLQVEGRKCGDNRGGRISGTGGLRPGGECVWSGSTRYEWHTCDVHVCCGGQRRLNRNLCAGQEGRAGMAAVITRPGATFDGKKLFEYAMRDLPAYARPLFIRLQVTAHVVLPHFSLWSQ